MVVTNAIAAVTLPQPSNHPPQFFTLCDGRQMAYNRVGDPNGRPVFFFHGSPGSRLEGLAAAAPALEHGWQIIAPDRPGMGQSDFKPGYTLLDYTDDVRQLADGLGFSTFGVMGHSGGGTTVLSCAYALPERLDFALDLGGWAPVAVPELRWRSLSKGESHMTALDRFFAERINSLQDTTPILFQLPFTVLGLAAKVLPAQTFIRLLYQSQYFCDADYAVLSAPNAANVLVSTVRESFHQGSEGPAHDALLRYQDWGFDLAAIDFPVHIFHGSDDVSAPYSFAEYKHRHLANSHLHIYPHEGHFFLWFHWNEIMEVV